MPLGAGAGRIRSSALRSMIARASANTSRHRGSAGLTSQRSLGGRHEVGQVYPRCALLQRHTRRIDDCHQPGSSPGSANGWSTRIGVSGAQHRARERAAQTGGGAQTHFEQRRRQLRVADRVPPTARTRCSAGSGEQHPTEAGPATTRRDLVGQVVVASTRPQPCQRLLGGGGPRRLGRFEVGGYRGLTTLSTPGGVRISQQGGIALPLDGRSARDRRR